MQTNELTKSAYLMITWDELEAAWRMLAMPDKYHQIPDTLALVQKLSIVAGPERAIFNIVAATAWLTTDDVNDLSVG